MSYCRFSNGDIYMYLHYLGDIKCCSCQLTNKKRYKYPEHIKQLIKEQTGKIVKYTYHY